MSPEAGSGLNLQLHAPEPADINLVGQSWLTSNKRYFLFIIFSMSSSGQNVPSEAGSGLNLQLHAPEPADINLVGQSWLTYYTHRMT
jgi:hypothetical protein